MNCKVEKSKLSGNLICPPNKSYTHRAIFLAVLAGNNSKVDNVLFSDDTAATINACKNFEYYSEQDCFGQNFQKFSGTCKGVDKDGGLLVVIPDDLSRPMTKILIKLTEKQ